MTVINESKKQTDKIVNYNGANNAYIYALRLMKEAGLTGFMDKIPFPCENNTVNIQVTPETQQQTQNTDSNVTSPQATKNIAKTALKAAVIGATLFGTGGAGAIAIPAILGLLEKTPALQEKATPILEKAKEIDPNFSFEVK
jgi:hypothetical protein